MEPDNDAFMNDRLALVAHKDSACISSEMAFTAVDKVMASSPAPGRPLNASRVSLEIDQIILAAVGTCTMSATSAVALAFWIPSTHHRIISVRSALVGFTLWWCIMVTLVDARIYLGWAESSAWLMAVLFWAIPYIMNSHLAYPVFTKATMLFAILATFSALTFGMAARLDRADAYQHQSRHRRSLRARQISRDTKTRHLSDDAGYQHVFLSIIAQELQSAALMAIATLEQFSPADILTHSNELLSACSIAVPISSVSAINTTIKQVYYISSHLNLVFRLLNQIPGASTLPKGPHKTFDTSELLQSIGDALAGTAAKQEIAFVIYHTDVGLHTGLNTANVIGDEDAIRHGLFNLLRHVLDHCTPGACIEFGLSVTRLPEHKLSVVYEVIHTASPAIRNPPSMAPFARSCLTRQLISYVGANLSIDKMRSNRTRLRITLEMTRSGEDEPALTMDDVDMYLKYANFKFSNEPTLNDLTAFIDNLKGLKMVLHAPERSVLAKHLTTCLAGWNTDICHIPILHPVKDSGADCPDDNSAQTQSMQESHQRHSSSDTHTFPAVSIASPRSVTTTPVPSPVIEEEQLHASPPAFLLIDDDIATLELKLREFRTQPPVSANMLQNHQHVRRHKRGKASISGPHQNFFHHGTTAIIHFTSLTRYKQVKDSIHVFATALTQPFAMPRVVVVPKPVGPRRFLTALHTAWNDAMVGPHYLPIATSPSSPVAPGMSMMMAMFQHSYSPHTPPGNHPYGTTSLLGQEMDKKSPGGIRRAGPDNYFCGSSPHDTVDPLAKLAVGRRRSRTELQHTSPMQPSHQVGTPSTENHVNEGAAKGPSPCSGSLPNGTNPENSSAEVEASTPLTKKRMSGGNNAVKLASPKGRHATTEATTPPDRTEPAVPAKKSTLRNMAKQKRKKKEKSTFNVVSPPINVLIVEDNMINQAILSAWMRKHKIKYSVASNGQEAVEKWNGGSFHLVLMDIQLPVMDGIEATRTIRSIEREQKIGVLPMSSSFLRQQQWLEQQRKDQDDQYQQYQKHQEHQQQQQQQQQQHHHHQEIQQQHHHQEAHKHPQHSQHPHSNYETQYPFSSSPPAATEKRAILEESPPSTFRSPVIIVALTASSLESDRNAALAAGCNDFLTKPVSLEWLDKKITEWGCMQALIDFEGWRRWKQSAAVPQNKAHPLLNPPPPATPAPAPHTRRLQRTGGSKNTKEGVLLLGASGAHKRRSSTASGGPNKYWAKTRMKKSLSEETGGQGNEQRGEELEGRKGRMGTQKADMAIDLTTGGKRGDEEQL